MGGEILRLCFVLVHLLLLVRVPSIDAESDHMKYSEVLLPENDCPERSLIVSASGGMGMCNQIDLMAYGLELARLTERTLCVYNFRTEYSRHHEVPVEEIIDINATNDKLAALPRELGFKGVRMVGYFNQHDHEIRNAENVCLRSVDTLTAPVGPKRCKFSGSHYINVPVDEKGRNDLIATLLAEHIKTHSRIHLSPGVPNRYDFFGHESETSSDRMSHLYRTITFAPFLQKASRGLMHRYNLTSRNFTAVHMRLEDDFVTSIWNQHDVDADNIDIKSFHFIMANDFVSFLLQHVSVRQPIFIVTGLTLASNTLNFMPYVMERLFNESDYHFPDKLYMKLPKRRELHAIVDALVAIRASSFIGFDPSASTFSKYVSQCLPPDAPKALLPINYTQKATRQRKNLNQERYSALIEHMETPQYYDLLRRENLDGSQTPTSTDLLLNGYPNGRDKPGLE